jgi:hypothetical protein
MPGVVLHAPRAPFYSPKAGAVGTPFGMQFLPSVRRCTGLSSGAPDSEHYAT